MTTQEILDLLSRLEDYMDDKSDVSGFAQDRPNKEMAFLIEIRSAIEHLSTPCEELNKRISELEEGLATEQTNHCESVNELQQRISELEREKERLKGVIKKLFSGGMKLTIGMWEDTDPEQEWKDFEKANNL